MGIDFSKGGYQGDVIEEAFKDFTTIQIPYWWHFREVLRSSDRDSPYWQRNDGQPLAQEDKKALIVLSQLNYSVYVEIASALSFLEQTKQALILSLPSQQRIFEVRKLWKATYSCLYASFNALSNIIYILIKPAPPFKIRGGKLWNYTPLEALGLVNGRGLNSLHKVLGQCNDRLEIRNQLDHYWTIWQYISQGQFLIDENFKKGYVPLDPFAEVSIKTDAITLTNEHITENVADYNLIYQELSVSGGYLDHYLSTNGWKIEYTDYGPPHNGQRPLP